MVLVHLVPRLEEVHRETRSMNDAEAREKVKPLTVAALAAVLAGLIEQGEGERIVMVPPRDGPLDYTTVHRIHLFTTTGPEKRGIVALGELPGA